MNTVSLIGYLGSDTEIRYTASGTPVAALSIAVHEVWKDEQGEKKEHTNWIKAVAWNRLAEIAGDYLKKGDRVAIVGSLRQHTYEDSTGNNRMSETWTCSLLKIAIEEKVISRQRAMLSLSKNLIELFPVVFLDLGETMKSL